ncbi:MAG: type ISP restriction/modification enzyme [Spirochaetia bacterium]
MLHHPTYRSTYKIDLAQNLPSVPISGDFFALSALGQALGDLHVSFDICQPHALSRSDKEILTALPKLKSYPDKGSIVIDEATTLTDIPPQAWEYKLGNRSAIDWVLESYKVKKISADNGDIGDPYSPLYQQHGYIAYTWTPQAKEECILMLQRIITLSLQTQELITQIGALRL